MRNMQQNIETVKALQGAILGSHPSLSRDGAETWACTLVRRMVLAEEAAGRARCLRRGDVKVGHLLRGGAS